MEYGAIDLHKKESQIRLLLEDGAIVDRGEHKGPSPRADGLHRVLSALAHTSRPRQGHTGHASGLTAVGRTYCRHPRSRRSTPPLRPHCRIAVARRRPQPQPSSQSFMRRTLSVLRRRCCGRSHPRTHRLRTQRGITGLWMGLDLRPYRLLDSHRIGRRVCSSSSLRCRRIQPSAIGSSRHSPTWRTGVTSRGCWTGSAICTTRCGRRRPSSTSIQA
jgi:hypothetical protein